MYWLRSDNPMLIFSWLATAGVWTLGGWLIATHAFRLEERERLLAGFGLVSAVGHRILQSPSHPFPALDATGKKKVSSISLATFHLIRGTRNRKVARK